MLVNTEVVRMSSCGRTYRAESKGSWEAMEFGVDMDLCYGDVVDLEGGEVGLLNTCGVAWRGESNDSRNNKRHRVQ